MRSSCTSERWTMMAALFVLIGLTLVPRGPVDAAVGQETLLPPTPLVLKDGRIANVSIHVLPFDRGDGELSGEAAAGLARLTAQIATDCFLTAQVIGHVSSREVADNETLAAHRLARSRADAVQSSLIGGGLPAKSIASVWDWQFLVREPRATLWVFRLIQGEDCEGLPLDGEAPQLVAKSVPAQPVQAETSVAEVATPVARERAVAEPAASAAPQATESAARVAQAPAPTAVPAPEPVEQAETPTLPAMVGSAVAAEPSPPQNEVQETVVAAAPADPGPPAPAPAAREADAQDTLGPAPAQAQPEGRAPAVASQRAVAEPQGRAAQVAVPAGPVRGAVPTVTRPIPALSPSQPAVGTTGDGHADPTVAAVEPAALATGRPQHASTDASPPQQAATQPDPERKGKVEWGQDGDVVITFATNSSYFPPGTTRRLGRMLKGMTSDERYQVQLRVGVSGTDKVVGATTPEEARRYNKWLAERRMARVQEWLTENARDRQLEIDPVFVADDSSRRVLVRIVPVS